ncbi:MAG: hypothetical protein IJE25_08615 [Clostridia bacterium]|nr:hypothetical protein [Clostridia bacterium]
MKATMFSTEKYIPMCLVGGRDAVYIGYDGSNFVSHNGHAHMETHQGAQTGWYKAASKSAMDFMQPSVMAGIQVKLYGAYVVPTSYEQEFVPEEATLYTTLTFRCGLKLRITAYFTYDSCIWGERVEILECPESISPEIGFRVSKPFLSERLGFLRKAECSFTSAEGNRIELNYITGDHTGRGALFSSRPFDKTDISSSKFADQCYAEGRYIGLTAGDVISRTMVLHGDNEGHIGYEELCSIAARGFDENFAEHKALWQSYYSTSEISLGDDELDYVIKLSRYLIKASQGADSGIVTLGMLPFHWRGAASCSWDEEMAHEAMLLAGSVKESRHFTAQYLKQAEDGYKILKKLGMPGVAFSGWNSILGEFCGHRPIEEWLTTFKPMFTVYSITSIYNQWRYDKAFDIEPYKDIIRDVLKFLLYRLVKKGEDGEYYLIEVKDGNETGVMVSVDTVTTMKFAEAFIDAYKMLGDTEYLIIGESLLRSLEGNRREDGVIMAARSSPYQSSTVEYFRKYYGVIPLDISVLEKNLAVLKTPFGYDSQVGTEEKRHWPWYDSWAARDFIVAKLPERAAEHISHLTYGCSSLGALPEFIRLDGVGIGYYYTTPHGSLVSAAYEAACAVSNKDEILLCYGLSGENINIQARGVHLPHGIVVDVRVENSKLLYLRIKNEGADIHRMPLSLNPHVKGVALAESISLSHGEEYVYNT